MTSPNQVFPSPSDDYVNIKDFTVREKRIRFRIDDDIFEAYGVMSMAVIEEVVVLLEKINSLAENRNLSVIFDVFDKLLFPDSAKRFRERGQAIGDEALGVREQIMPILYFLLEKYGMRPTQPSSSSSDGLRNESDGITSTDGSLAQPAGL